MRRSTLTAHSLPGEFFAYSKQKTGNQKPETVLHVPILSKGEQDGSDIMRLRGSSQYLSRRAVRCRLATEQQRFAAARWPNPLPGQMFSEWILNYIAGNRNLVGAFGKLAYVSQTFRGVSSFSTCSLNVKLVIILSRRITFAADLLFPLFVSRR